ncbi:MAG: DUF445 family protein [Pseudomonadota bacterium]
MDLNSEDRAKLRQLRRVKMLATATLVACLLVFVVSKYLSHTIPAFAPVAAFAEAATIGGLADWYAVVVLFRHPLGLKIPHTAIIPANQERIGDNLGVFLERNFLTDAIVREKLAEVDFAHHMTTYLSDRTQSDELAQFVVRLLPDVLDAIESSGFKDQAARRIARQVAKVPVTPVAMDLIDTISKDKRFGDVFGDVLVAVERVLSDERTRETIEKRVAKELPTVLYVFQTEGVILKRILSSAAKILQEVRADPDHPTRAEFVELFEGYVERLKSSKRFQRRIERFKGDLLASPQLTTLADRIWDNLGEFIDKDAGSDDPVLARQLAGILVGLANELEQNGHLRDEVNSGIRRMLLTLVAGQKSQVSAFVADQVKSWDFKQLVTLIEANVGRDLQFIRFNGMIVGGIAGLILYALEISLLPF